MAYESVIVLCESFIFHIIRLRYVFVSPRQNKDIKSQGGSMKRVLGILVLSCICLILGLSVRWFRENDMTLITTQNITDISENML